MTVIHCFCLSSSRRKRWPITSVRFGHSRFANTPLTIATADRPCPSASVKSRPATSGTLSVFSRCGVTPKYETFGSWPVGERHAFGNDRATRSAARSAAPCSTPSPTRRQAALRPGARCRRRGGSSPRAARTDRPACRTAASSAARCRCRRARPAGSGSCERTATRRPAARATARSRATTSVLRRRLRAPPALPRPPSFSESCRFVFAAWSAGARPKTSPVSSGDGDGVDDDARVHAPVDVVRRLVLRRNRRRQPLQTDVGDRDAERRGGQRNQHALGEQLPDDAAASGAERGANRDLALTHRRARQQQVGDVGARDQQHQADRAHHREDDEPDVGRHHVVAQRHARSRPIPDRRAARRPAATATAAMSRRASSSETPGFSRAIACEVPRRPRAGVLDRRLRDPELRAVPGTETAAA